MSAKTTKKPVGVCECGFGIAEHAMGDTICKNFKSNTGETVMTTLREKIEKILYDETFVYPGENDVDRILLAIKEELPKKKQSPQRFYSGHNAGFTEAIAEMERRLG